MTRAPGPAGEDEEPDGGRAAERLRHFLAARPGLAPDPSADDEPDGSADDPPEDGDDPRKVSGVPGDPEVPDEGAR